MTASTHEEPSDFIKSLEGERQRQAQFYSRLSEIQTYCQKLTQDDLPPIWAQNKIGSDTADHFKNIMIDHFGEIYIRFKLRPDSSVLDRMNSAPVSSRFHSQNRMFSNTFFPPG